MAPLSGVSSFFRRGRFIKFGVPFFVLILGGSYGLTYFSKVRYEYRGQKQLSRVEADQMGVKMKKPGEVTMEGEFGKLQNLDIDTWENKRGPRPWEADNPSMKEINQRLQAKSP